MSAELLLLLTPDFAEDFFLGTDFFCAVFFDFADVFFLGTDFFCCFLSVVLDALDFELFELFGFERFERSEPDVEISLSGIRIPSDSRALRALFVIKCWERGAEKAHGSKTMRKQDLRGCRIGFGLR